MSIHKRERAISRLAVINMGSVPNFPIGAVWLAVALISKHTTFIARHDEN